jgi:hypothetical protein
MVELSGCDREGAKGITRNACLSFGLERLFPVSPISMSASMGSWEGCQRRRYTEGRAAADGSS